MTKKGDVSPELVTDDNVYPARDQEEPELRQGLALRRRHQGPRIRRSCKRNYYFGRTMSTCAIHDDIVYIADLDGILHCLDANTGTVHWEFDTGSDIWCSPYYADGKVYLGTDGKATSSSSSTARTRRTPSRSPRTTWTAGSGPRRSPPTAFCT